VLQLLVTSNVAPGSLIIFSMMLVPIISSETSYFTRDPRRNIPEHGILEQIDCLRSESVWFDSRNYSGPLIVNTLNYCDLSSTILLILVCTEMSSYVADMSSCSDEKIPNK
jgi:hypothetical protein